MKLKIFLLFFLINAALFTQTSEPLNIRIEKKDRGNIYLDILLFLVESSQGQLKLDEVDIQLTQAREFSLIKEGELDLGHAGTSYEMEQNYIPVRIPILRGLGGYRLLMLNKNLNDEFNKIKTIEELGIYQGVQGVGWIDAAILSKGGLPQREVLWNNIFPLLDDGRRETYLPFGVLETYHKFDQYNLSETDIIIHDTLAIHYPHCIFFFVNDQRQDIADALTKVFLKTYIDGSFLDFFYSHPYITESLNKANLDSRTILKVENPFLSDETKAIPAEYFH